MPELVGQGAQRHGDHDLGALSAVVGQLVAGQGSAGKLDEGVGAALGGGTHVSRAVGGGHGCGQRVQGGAQHGGRLGCQPASQPVQPVPVVDHGELAALRGALLGPGQLLGLQPLQGVRRDDLQDVPAQPGQLRGVEPVGLADQVRLGAPAHVRPGLLRQCIDRADDRGGLRVADPSGGQRVPGPGHVPARCAGYRRQFRRGRRGHRQPLPGQRRRARAAQPARQFTGVGLADEAHDQALQAGQRRARRRQQFGQLGVGQRPQRRLGNPGQHHADLGDRGGHPMPELQRRQIIQQCAHTLKLATASDTFGRRNPLRHNNFR